MSNAKVTLTKVLVGASDLYYTALEGSVKMLPVYHASGGVRYWRVFHNGEERHTSKTLRAVKARIAKNFVGEGLEEHGRMLQRLEEYLVQHPEERDGYPCV